MKLGKTLYVIGFALSFVCPYLIIRLGSIKGSFVDKHFGIITTIAIFTIAFIFFLGKILIEKEKNNADKQ